MTAKGYCKDLCENFTPEVDFPKKCLQRLLRLREEELFEMCSKMGVRSNEKFHGYAVSAYRSFAKRGEFGLKETYDSQEEDKIINVLTIYYFLEHKLSMKKYKEIISLDKMASDFREYEKRKAPIPPIEKSRLDAYGEAFGSAMSVLRNSKFLDKFGLTIDFTPGQLGSLVALFYDKPEYSLFLAEVEEQDKKR